MTQPNRFRTLITTAGAFALVAGGSATAGDYGKAVIDDKMPIEGGWSFCDIFDYASLYEGDGFIREVALTGRYHGQYISQSEEEGGLNNGFHNWQHRRARLGLDVEMAPNLLFTSSFNVSDGSGDSFGFTRGRFFDDLDEFAIEWEPSEDFYVIVGKQKQKITMENMESSKRILTVERSQIVNEVISDKPWGIVAGFNLLGLEHEVGAWINGADLDSSGEGWLWPDFDSRGGATYRVNKDITDATTAYFGYQFTNNDNGDDSPAGRTDASLGSAYNHVLHLGTKSEWGRLGLITDVIYGANREGSGLIPDGNDTWGFVLLPYYDITDKLQFVAKYAYMDEGRQQRYQRYFVRQNMDGYHTLYAGFNYYICEHKLKLMGGYEYATGDEFGTGIDIDSSSWVFAVRTYW